MARIFITGSADGLGYLSANLLIQQGHKVLLHARNAERAREAVRKTPKAEAIVMGDLTSIDETINLGRHITPRSFLHLYCDKWEKRVRHAHNVRRLQGVCFYLLPGLIGSPGDTWHQLIYLITSILSCNRISSDELPIIMSNIPGSTLKPCVFSS